MFLSNLKVVNVCIFRDSSGKAFHNFDAAYLHDLNPKVVDFTFGRSSIVVPLRLLEHHASTRHCRVHFKEIKHDCLVTTTP